MESYQMPRSDRDTITAMTSKISMVTDTASEVISIPTKCSKPFLEVPGVADLPACMEPLSVSGEDLGAALFSNLVKNDLLIAIWTAKKNLPTVMKLKKMYQDLGVKKYNKILC